jgi:hypothetical protein
MVEELTAVIKSELAVTEPTLTVTLEEVKLPKKVIDKKVHKRSNCCNCCLPKCCDSHERQHGRSGGNIYKHGNCKIRYQKENRY